MNKNIVQAIALLAIAITALPSYATNKLNIPIEQAPCKTITLPDESTACEPPKVSQADCITVTIREAGKPDRKILVCEQPRPPKETPQKPLPKVGGY